MCVLEMDITAPPVSESVTSYIFNLQSGRSQSLHPMSVASSLIHAGHEQDSAADMFVFPFWTKKETTGEAIRAQEPRTSHNQWLQALAKGCASPTYKWPDACWWTWSRMQGKGGVWYFCYSIASTAGTQ